MTTPPKLKPGEVEHLARWVTPVPQINLLPVHWVASERLLPRVNAVLDAYQERATHEALVREAKLQNDGASAWLLDALKALKSGDFTRLQGTPASPMPGQADPACWYEAHKRGLDFGALVRAGDIKRVREIVEAARSALQRSAAAKAPAKRGRKPLSARDRLLRDLRKLLSECTIKKPHQPVRPVTLGEARAAAESILIACRIKVPAHEKSIGRAERRA
jgi:hypothetical protein